MTMRQTPYERIRYPWASDAVAVGDAQSMAQDIDQALVTTARLSSDFSKFASVTVKRAAAQSITKATVTAISFDTVTSNNGANSPLSNGAWFAAGTPTRLTAPVPCLVLASGTVGMNFGSALGTSGALQVHARLNGGTNVQGTKWAPISTATGQQWASALTMWKLAAADYLELMVFWTGTPAGPFNTDTVIPPIFSLMMVGLQSVP